MKAKRQRACKKGRGSHSAARVAKGNASQQSAKLKNKHNPKSNGSLPGPRAAEGGTSFVCQDVPDLYLKKFSF